MEFVPVLALHVLPHATKILYNIYYIYYTITAKFPFTQKTHNNVVFATIFSATPGGQEKPYPVRKPESGQDVTVFPDRTYANSYYIWSI